MLLSLRYETVKLNPWSGVFPDKLRNPELLKFPAFYGTQMFITVFKIPRFIVRTS
jgi:hypothetical protein